MELTTMPELIKRLEKQLNDTLFEMEKIQAVVEREKWHPVAQKPPINRNVILWIPLYGNTSTGCWDGEKYTVDSNALGEPTHWKYTPIPPTV